MSLVNMNKYKDLIIIGKITSVYGVKGWVKVFSYTEPMDQILDYPNWLISNGGPWESIDVDSGRSHGKGMVTHIQGCDDREIAKNYSGYEIAVEKTALANLEHDDYYWHELVGLIVWTIDGQKLGRVDHMMSAGGANDVIVVKANRDSIDKRERMIPYLYGEVIKRINLEEKIIEVDWNPEF